MSGLLHHLPLTEHPNGFTLACLLVLVAVCWCRVVVRRRAHDYRLEVADALGYDLDGGELFCDCNGPRTRADKRLATEADR